MIIKCENRLFWYDLACYGSVYPEVPSKSINHDWLV